MMQMAHSLLQICMNSVYRITTLSPEKRVRNYSEFSRKRVAKKTGP